MRNTQFVACAALLAGSFLSIKLAQHLAARAQDGGGTFESKSRGYTSST
jgi:hypothetical protein